MVYMPFQNQGPNAVDRFMDTRVRQQQLALSEQATAAAERRTKLAERAQSLEEMATAWKVLPGGSPQRVELMNRFYGLSGGTLGPMKIPPVDAEKITQNVVGELSRLSADVAAGRRLPQDLMRRAAELYPAAMKEIYAMPGYDPSEREAMVGAVRDIGRTGLAGIEAQGGTVEHGIQAGQTAGAQISVSNVQASNARQLANLKADREIDKIAARLSADLLTTEQKHTLMMEMQRLKGSQSLDKIAAELGADLTTGEQKAKFNERLQAMRQSGRFEEIDRAYEYDLNLLETRQGGAERLAGQRFAYDTSLEAQRTGGRLAVEGERGEQARMTAEARAMAERNRRLDEIDAKLRADLTTGKADARIDRALERQRQLGRMRLQDQKADDQYQRDLLAAEVDLEEIAREGVSDQEKEVLKARLERRQARLESQLREGQGIAIEEVRGRNRRREARLEARLKATSPPRAALSPAPVVSAFNAILREKREANKGAGTRTVDVKVGDTTIQRTEAFDLPLTPEDIAAAKREAMALVNEFNAVANPVAPGEGAAAKRRRGAVARAAEERVAAGQSASQAAVGAAVDEYGPGLVYGLPPVGETPPEAAAAALDDALALWRAANPGGDPAQAEETIMGILRDGGYLDANGAPTPTHAAALAAVLRKYGMVD